MSCLLEFASKFFQKTRHKVFMAFSFVVLKSKKIPFLLCKLRSCYYSRITAHFLDFLKRFVFKTLMQFNSSRKLIHEINQAKMHCKLQIVIILYSLCHIPLIIVSIDQKCCMHLKMNLIYDAFLKYHNLALFRIFLMQINDVARN